MGAPAAVLEDLAQQLEARRTAAVFRVWPEHWHAVAVFRLMGTQWRAVAHPQGGLLWLGLDYASLAAPLRAARDLVDSSLRQPMHQLLQQLQTIEKAATTARNTKA